MRCCFSDYIDEDGRVSRVPCLLSMNHPLHWLWLVEPNHLLLLMLGSFLDIMPLLGRIFYLFQQHREAPPPSSISHFITLIYILQWILFTTCLYIYIACISQRKREREREAKKERKKMIWNFSREHPSSWLGPPAGFFSFSVTHTHTHGSEREREKDPDKMRARSISRPLFPCLWHHIARRGYVDITKK